MGSLVGHYMSSAFTQCCIEKATRSFVMNLKEMWSRIVLRWGWGWKDINCVKSYCHGGNPPSAGSGWEHIPWRQTDGQTVSFHSSRGQMQLAEYGFTEMTINTSISFDEEMERFNSVSRFPFSLFDVLTSNYLMQFSWLKPITQPTKVPDITRNWQGAKAYEKCGVRLCDLFMKVFGPKGMKSVRISGY